MWQDLALRWRQHLERETGLADSTISSYEGDALAWAAWAQRQRIHTPEEVTAADVKEWRDAREQGAGRAPATVNRRLVSLALLLDFAGRQANNPARKVEQLQDADSEDGRALSRNEWNAVRRQAEKAGALATALADLFRFAGPRVGEVGPQEAPADPPLLLGDLTISARAGELRIRKGKGGKRRTVPLVLEAREPLRDYIRGDRALKVDAWAAKRRLTEAQRSWWSSEQAPVFLGERGPLTVRGIRHIVAGLGRDAGLDYTLGPHDLRATFITALLDPSKYGLNREPVPLTVAQRLAGHADISTTARYARPSQDDLARWMGNDLAI